jgi:hypothetical protein
LGEVKEILQQAVKPMQIWASLQIWLYPCKYEQVYKAEVPDSHSKKFILRNEKPVLLSMVSSALTQQRDSHPGYRASTAGRGMLTSQPVHVANFCLPWEQSEGHILSQRITGGLIASLNVSDDLINYVDQVQWSKGCLEWPNNKAKRVKGRDPKWSLGMWYFWISKKCLYCRWCAV